MVWAKPNYRPGGFQDLGDTKMSTTTISKSLLSLAGQKAPLYHVYPQQLYPQSAFISLDESGTVSADYDGEIGNAVPMNVWHGRTMRFAIPCDLSGDAIIDLVNEARPLDRDWETNV